MAKLNNGATTFKWSGCEDSLGEKGGPVLAVRLTV
jgi:hypothetical protein